MYHQFCSGHPPMSVGILLYSRLSIQPASLMYGHFVRTPIIRAIKPAVLGFLAATVMSNNNGLLGRLFWSVMAPLCTARL